MAIFSTTYIYLHVMHDLSNASQASDMPLGQCYIYFSHVPVFNLCRSRFKKIGAPHRNSQNRILMTYNFDIM